MINVTDCLAHSPIYSSVFPFLFRSTQLSAAESVLVIVGRGSAFGHPCDKQHIKQPDLDRQDLQRKLPGTKSSQPRQSSRCKSYLLLCCMALWKLLTRKLFRFFFSFLSQHNVASPKHSNIIGYSIQIHEI